jgi:hypothetical protein
LLLGWRERRAGKKALKSTSLAKAPSRKEPPYYCILRCVDFASLRLCERTLLLFIVEIAKILGSCATLHGINGSEAVARSFLPQLIAAHARGLFPLEKITRHYKFENINGAIRDAESGTTIKPVLLMQDMSLVCRWSPDG